MIHANIIKAFLVTGYQLYFLNHQRFKKLQQEITGFLTPLNLSIDKQLLYRINFYMMQSTLTNFWFGTLRGQKPTQNETLAGVYLGAYTPIYDDLVDDETLDHEAIVQLQLSLHASKTNYALIYFLYKNLQLHLPVENDFEHYFKLNGEAQTASLEQLGNNRISNKTLHKLTADKGGYATLLYRSIMHHPFKKGEATAIYNLGASLQYLNDLFDIYKDSQQGIQTLFNQAPAVTDMHSLYMEQIHQALAAIYACEYKEVQKKNILPYIKIIWSRGLVFLEQLKSLTPASGDFDLSKYSRQQLICDMEKPRNILRSLQLAATI